MAIQASRLIKAQFAKGKKFYKKKRKIRKLDSLYFVE
jgi:hypothetical protein